MKKIYSYLSAIILGLLCVAPPEFLLDASTMAINLGAKDPVFKSDYAIPVVVNSFNWLYAVIAAGLAGFFIVQKDLHLAIKFLTIYLFVGAFFSEVPFLSFNAYLLIIPTILFFILLRECDFRIITSMAVAAFCLEMTIAVLRLMGKDTLMNFGRPEPIFFGTIFQHMRFASLLCILSPFLILKSKWFMILIAVAVALCASSGFALAILAGALVYLALKRPPKRLVFCFLVTVLPLLALGLWLGRDSFAVAIREGRFPIWLLVIKSWLFDTRAVAFGPPDWLGIAQDGPFSWKTFLFGHGTDTFYAMFSAYKHDPNPFAQAHNCWLQLPWEIGLVGAAAFVWYCAWLCVRLYKAQEHECLAGLAIIGTNMMSHFPTRMTQTIWLMVAFAALCEQRIRHRIALRD